MFLEWLQSRDPIIVYLFLFGNAFFESLFPPYPSDVFVLIFSFIAGQGHFNKYLVYFTTVLGSIAGIMVIYYIGKTMGERLIALFSKSFLGKIFPLRFINLAKQKFAEHGALILILNRFLPGMRAAICFVAGVVNIKGKNVFLFSLLSILIWNFSLISVGFYVGANWHEASSFLKSYNVIVTIIFILFSLLFATIYFHKKRQS